MEKSKNLYSECFPVVSGYYCVLKKLELERIVDPFWVWPGQQRMQDSGPVCFQVNMLMAQVCVSFFFFRFRSFR